MNHSEKTKAGIAKAKAAGTQWGAHGSVLAEKNNNDAQEFAESLRSVILGLMLDAIGAKQRGPKALAVKLNELGIPTARGGKWHPATVHRLMKRLEPGLSVSFKKAKQENQETFTNGSDFLAFKQSIYGSGHR